MATKTRKKALPTARVDGHGDPLPDGVIVRLGTRRFNEHARRLAFSPDGTVLAASSAHTVSLWDTRTGALLDTIKPRLAGEKDFKLDCAALVYSPDGKRLAAALGARLYVWDITALTKPIVEANQPRALRSLAWSPDGTRLLAIDRYGHLLTLRDAASGAVLAEAATRCCEAVAFAPGGETAGVVCEADDEYTLHLLDLSRLKTQQTIRIGAARRTTLTNRPALAFQTDGALAVCLPDNTLWQVEGATAHQRRDLGVASDSEPARAFDLSGRRLALTDGRRTRAWDVLSGQLVFEHATRANPTAVALSADGTTVAICDFVRLRVFDVASQTEVVPLGGHTGGISGAEFVGDTIVSSGHDDTLRTWDPVTGKELSCRPFHGRILPLGTHLCEFVDEGKMAIHQGVTPTSGPLAEVPFEFSPDPLVTPDGRYLVTRHKDDVRLHRLPGGEIERTYSGEPSRVHGVGISADGLRLAVAFWWRPIAVVYERDSGERVATLQGARKGLEALAFSPDGDLLAGGGHDRSVWVWTIASGRVRHTLTGHKSVIVDLAFSPDGKLIASTDRATVRLWDARTGAARATLDEVAFGLAFDASGGRLLTAGGATIHVWDVAAF